MRQAYMLAKLEFKYGLFYIVKYIWRLQALASKKGYVITSLAFCTYFEFEKITVEIHTCLLSGRQLVMLIWSEGCSGCWPRPMVSLRQCNDSDPSINPGLRDTDWCGPLLHQTYVRRLDIGAPLGSAHQQQLPANFSNINWGKLVFLTNYHCLINPA